MRIVLSCLKFLILIFSLNICADEIPPPPEVALCDISDKWLGQVIGTNGLLAPIELPGEEKLSSTDTALTDTKGCSKSEPVLVDLSKVSDCLYGMEGTMWRSLELLRDRKNKLSANVKLYGFVRKATRPKYRYNLRVTCIKELKIVEPPNNSLHRTLTASSLRSSAESRR